jgi:hypothetical protein
MGRDAAHGAEIIIASRIRTMKLDFESMPAMLREVD